MTVPIGVAPRFAPVANLDQNPATTVDNVRIRFLRDDGTVAIDTIVMWPADQDTLRVEVEVEVEGAGETFDFLLQARDGEITIFQSEGQLDVDSGGTGPPPDLTPELEYQGEGASATELEVDAPSSMLAGGSVTLSATARDGDGAELPATIVWSSLDEDAATVDDAGVMTAGHRVDLQARIVGRIAFKDVADTVEIPIRAAGVRLTPESGQLDALGRTLSLSAEAFGADDAAVQGTAFDWRLLDESVLSLAADGDEAEVTSLKSGTARVEVEAGGHADTARVTVRQVVESLTLSSPSATLTAGQTIQLEVVAADGEGTAVAAPDVRFASSDETIATVDADGMVTGVGVGEATITASVDGDAAASVAATTATVAAASVAATPTAAAAKTAAGGGSAAEPAPAGAKSAAQAEVVASVTLTVEPGSAESFTVVSGNGQTGTAGAALPEPVVVRLADAAGNPIAGADIAFSAAAGSFEPATATTDAEGQASSIWTLKPAAGANTGSATAPGTDLAALSLTATGEAGPPASLAAVSGGGQAAVVGGTLTNPLVVAVTDAGGNPVAGVTVGFATPDGGGFSSASPVTGPDGLASTSWTLGPGAGAQGATAAVTGLAGSPVAFSATAGAGTVEAVVVISGNSQSGTVGAVLPKPLVVEARDANGNPVPGATIGFATTHEGAFSTAREGSFEAPLSVTADAAGRARAFWKLGTSAGPQTATASGSGSVTLTATARPGPAAIIASLEGTDDQEGEVNTPLPADPVAIVVDEFFNPLTGVTVHFTPLEGNGTVSPATATTDASGQASTTWTLGPTAQDNIMLATTPGLPDEEAVFIGRAGAGAPGDIFVVSGDGQTGRIGSVLPDPLVAQLNDGSGNPVASQTVTFTGSDGATFSTSSEGPWSPSLEVQTDADGQASAFERLGTDGFGAVVATATASGLEGHAAVWNHTATITPDEIAHLNGAERAGTVNQLLESGLDVIVLNTSASDVDLLVEGELVNWSSPDGVTFSTDGGETFSSAAQTLDGEAGVHHVEAMLGPATGTQIVNLALDAYPGVTAQFTITASSEIPDAASVASLIPITPTVFEATVADAVTVAVVALDADGAPVPGVQVAWSGNGSFDPNPSTTDVDGEASTTWTLDTVAGTQTATADVIEGDGGEFGPKISPFGFSASVTGPTGPTDGPTTDGPSTDGSPALTFTATANPGPFAAFALTGTPPGRIIALLRSRNLNTFFKTKDQFGNDLLPPDNQAIINGAIINFLTSGILEEDPDLPGAAAVRASGNGTTQVTLTRNGITSDPITIEVNQQVGGLFFTPPGQIKGAKTGSVDVLGTDVDGNPIPPGHLRSKDLFFDVLDNPAVELDQHLRDVTPKAEGAPGVTFRGWKVGTPRLQVTDPESGANFQEFVPVVPGDPFTVDVDDVVIPAFDLEAPLTGRVLDEPGNVVPGISLKWKEASDPDDVIDLPVQAKGKSKQKNGSATVKAFVDADGDDAEDPDEADGLGTVTVQQEDDAITITPDGSEAGTVADPVLIPLGGSRTFTIVVTDKRGFNLKNPEKAWSSDNPAITADPGLTINAEGVITATATGVATATAQLTFTSKNESAQIHVRVTGG